MFQVNGGGAIHSRRGACAPLATALCALVLLPSCTALSLSDQRHLQKPAMRMGESGALAGSCTLPGQIERGRSLSSSSAGGGCASCH